MVWSMSLVMLRGWLVSSREEECDAITGAQPIHLADHVFVEVAHAVVVLDVGVLNVAGGISPLICVGPRKSHVADAQAVKVAQQARVIFNGMAAFNAHQRGEFMLVMRSDNIVG